MCKSFIEYDLNRFMRARVYCNMCKSFIEYELNRFMRAHVYCNMCKSFIEYELNRFMRAQPCLGLISVNLQEAGHTTEI